MIPASEGGGEEGVAPVPCPKNSYIQATFDALFGFGVSYEILPQKGFYKEKKKKKPLQILVLSPLTWHISTNALISYSRKLRLER